MSHITRLLWLVPLAIHVGYFTAVSGQLPRNLGADLQTTGTTKSSFVIEWFAMIGIANIVFLLLHARLPHLKDKQLKTPGSVFWLSNETNRKELINRLRGLCELALLTFNIFFLAVFQMIYQSNVMRPRLLFPDHIILWGFIAMPLGFMAVFAAVIIWKLFKDAKS